MVSFRRVITALLTLALVALFTGGAFGQTIDSPEAAHRASGYDGGQPGPAGPSLQSTRTGVAYMGTSYNPQGSPNVAMNLAGFYAVMDDDKLYAGAALDVAWKPNQQPKVLIRPEVLPRLYTLEINGHKLPIYGIVGLGLQIEPSDPVATLANLRAVLTNVGTNYGLNAAIGLTTSIPITGSLYLSPSFRWVGGDGKPAQIAGIGISWKFKVARKQ